MTRTHPLLSLLPAALLTGGCLVLDLGDDGDTYSSGGRSFGTAQAPAAPGSGGTAAGGAWGGGGAASSGTRQLGFEAVVSHLELEVCPAGRRVRGRLIISAEQVPGAPVDAEGTLRFPLPPGAALHGAELEVDGPWIAAELVGRREAHDVYDDVVRPEPPPPSDPPDSEVWRDPLVIHQVDEDLYRALLYPVRPDRPYRFAIHYSHLADEEGADLVLPFLAPGWNDGQGGVPRELHVRFCPAAGRVVVPVDDSDDGPDDWVLGELDDGARVFSTVLSELEDGARLHALVQAPAPAETELTTYRDGAGRTWLHGTVLPPLPDGVEDPARRAAFLLDVSGSMAGGKIIEAVKAVAACLTTLEPGDRFAVAAFSSGTSAFAEGFVDVSADSLARVRAWLEAQRSGGGTDLAGALQRVVPWVAAEAAEEVAELVVVTDGRPNGYTIGSERLEDWVARQARVTGDRLRVHTVGIGHDVDAPLLRELAHETGGRAVFALDDAEVVGLVRATFAEVGPGGLSDPTLAVWGEGLAGVVTSARGAVRHGERIELGARVDGAETLHVRLTATLPDDCAYEAEWTLDVPAPDGGLGGLTVPPLYGRLRAARTYRAMEDAGETDDLLLAAALVLRRFGLVGRYSGYLGLESEALYAERGIRRVERDPADVALDDLADTALPAGRIGGEGALDGHQADPWADPAGAGAVSADYERSGAALDAGCGCSAGASGAAASAPLLLLLGLSVLALRVLRRGMSD